MILLYSIIACIIIASDRFVKIWTQANVALGEKFGGIPHIADFVFVKNTGAAFSMFSGKVSVLSAVSVTFCIGVIIYWIVKKPKNPLLCVSLTLLFSGAAGNAIDRIMNGFVVDYIELTFINFPVFNIADIAITLGAALMVLYVIVFDKEKNSNG